MIWPAGDRRFDPVNLARLDPVVLRSTLGRGYEEVAIRGGHEHVRARVPVPSGLLLQDGCKLGGVHDRATAALLECG